MVIESEGYSIEKIEVKRFLISNSIKYCYFGVKQTIPMIKPIEKIVEGLVTKDAKKIGAGIVETVAGELITTILLELVETNQQSNVH